MQIISRLPALLIIRKIHECQTHHYHRLRTSWHSAQIGMYAIEEFARIPVEVEYSSEFRYRKPVINKDDIVIAISQSGETADTLTVVELAKQHGAFIFGICNVVGSSIPRNTHSGCYTHVGPEIEWHPPKLLRLRLLS